MFEIKKKKKTFQHDITALGSVGGNISTKKKALLKEMTHIVLPCLIYEPGYVHRIYLCINRDNQ